MQISPSERESSQLDTGSLEIACRQLREIGYVILKSVFESGSVSYTHLTLPTILRV